MLPNFGGWIGQTHQGGFLQVSLRRVRGILSGPFLRDERDGLQVSGNSLVRAYVHHDDPDPDTFVDDRIEPGTVWTLDALVGLRREYDEERCRAERRAFADPPRIAIDRIVLPAGTAK